MGVVPNVLFAVCALIGAILVLVPLPRHLATLNLGVTLLLVWTEFACVIEFANAVRWNGNVENWSPLWCDFCGRFLSALDVALTGTAVSVNRRLYMIVTLDPRQHEKALNITVDVVLGIVIPWASDALQYIVQEYRFYIYEDIGCMPGVASVTLSYPLVYMLPLLLGVISVVYVALTLWTIYHRNREGIPDHHRMSGLMHTGWTRRLLAVGVFSALYVLIPTTLSIILLASANPVMAWPGWDAIHSKNHIIVPVPAEVWQSNPVEVASNELRRWTTVTLAFVLFGLLGFTEDVKKMYWRPFARLVEPSSSSIAHSRSGSAEQGIDVNEDEINMKSALRSSQCFRDYLLWGKSRTPPNRPFPLVVRPKLDHDMEDLQSVIHISRYDIPPKSLEMVV